MNWRLLLLGIALSLAVSILVSLLLGGVGVFAGVLVLPFFVRQKKP